jgi:hypothetical protein
MGLMDILRSAQSGEFFASAGRAAGLDAAATKRALTRMGPAIAAKLRERAEDPDAFEGLLDLLEDGEGDAFLDDSNFMDDPEVVNDGNAVLADIYGSVPAAQKALGVKANDAPMQRLAAIAASAVLAALARSYRQPQPQSLAGAQSAQGEAAEQGGFFSSVIEAVVKGAVQEATRQFGPKRRRRRPSISDYFGTGRKRTTRRKRSSTLSLDQIFGEILGTIRR